MITWLNLFENPLLIRFQSDQKLTFNPVRTNKSGPKMSFGTIHWHVIDKLFENSLLIHLHWFELDQKWVFDQFESRPELGGSKVSRHTYASRDLPPWHTLLDKKLDPSVVRMTHKIENLKPGLKSGHAASNYGRVGGSRGTYRRRFSIFNFERFKSQWNRNASTSCSYQWVIFESRNQYGLSK